MHFPVPFSTPVRTRVISLRHLAAPAAAAVGLVVLSRQVDLPRAAESLRFADGRWLVIATVLSTLSMGAGAVTWGLFARAGGLRLTWAQVMSWSGRAVFFGQLVPGGAGGDAVRVVAGRAAGGLGPAIASDLMARVCGSVAITLWALVAALILRDDVGWAVVWVAMALAGGTWVSLAILLDSDRLVRRLEGRRARWARAVSAKLHPLVDPLGSFRERPGLIVQTLLWSIAGWGLNLAALVCLGHAVGAALGWQVFAVTIPCTLVTTMLPLSANGVGMREGILISLLSRAGIAGAHAAALSVLVDLQLVPVALLGILIGLKVPHAHTAPQPVLRVEGAVPVVAPAAALAHVSVPAPVAISAD